MKRALKLLSWIHSDIMDDNVYMEPCCTFGSNEIAALTDNGSVNGHNNGGEVKSWRPNYIIDFSDLSIGDPLYDVIPIHLDVFRGNSSLLKQFLQSYKLPLMQKTPENRSINANDKFGRLSYQAMCYCILHDENVLGAIFSLWTELQTAETWEEVEQMVWGELNNYQGVACHVTPTPNL
ncbi:F-box protein isoform X1 [Gossypium australe]|uniref:F-box protein isoform X1 n=1 Tax=Gossypium australe TaxID=47621 RepID=A0A5B6VC08_9ROSI|nr:F-box protein isoform X1 [Gossypium australe]